MKVLLVNGSSRKEGCTHAALRVRHINKREHKKFIDFFSKIY